MTKTVDPLIAIPFPIPNAGQSAPVGESCTLVSDFCRKPKAMT